MRYKICIICEGYEEEEYIQRLKNKNLFHEQYVINSINAKGISNIFNRFQYIYSQNSFHLVLIYCDTDKGYVELKNKINSMFNTDVTEKLIYFANPCTMQIILSHFAKVGLKKSSKKVNRKIIEELTGISNYDATVSQRKELMNKIKQSNFKTMKDNLASISKVDTDVPSSNFLHLIENLESDSVDWIKEINDILNQATNMD